MTPQTIIDIGIPDLITKVREFQAKGARLIQICCTRLPDKLEMHYSFDQDYQFTSLRLSLVDTQTPIPSVSGVYLPAFLYENEIHDLFGVKVTGIAVDFQGKFYRTATPRAFNPEVLTGEVKA